METISNDSIHIEKKINAPVKDIWRAWTDPATILKWFGSDPNGWGLKAELDVQPGGHFEITFCNGDGAEHTCSGEYKDVQEFSRLSFSWMWKSEPGVTSFVTVALPPEGNITQMQFTHANVGTASAHNYVKGWESAFLKLEKALAAPANRSIKKEMENN